MTRYWIRIIWILGIMLFALGIGVLWAQPVAADGPPPIDIDIGDLPLGKEITIIFDVVITDTLPPGVLQVSNQGTITGTNFSAVSTDDPDTAAPNDPTVTGLDVKADMQISKSVTPTLAAPGRTVTYTLVYSNPGPMSASGVVITDVVPISLTNVLFTYSGVPVTPRIGSRYIWDVDIVPPGQGGVITISGQLSTTLPHGHVFTNTAAIAATPVDTDTTNNSSIVSVTVDADPPTPPTLVSPTDGTITTTDQVTLTWTASPSSDVAGYLLLLDAVADVGSVTAYAPGVLTDGTHYWTVAAYDGPGNTSPYTDSWSFTVDTTPPSIESVSPPDEESDVPRNAPFIVYFDEPMNTGSVSITVTPAATLTPTWGGGDARLTLIHDELAAVTPYTITATAGSDPAGHPLANAPYTWVFTTSAVSAPEADLSLNKARLGTGIVTGGDRITYTFTITNAGPTMPVTATIIDAFSDVSVLDTVAGEGCSWMPGHSDVTCIVPDLVSGSPTTLTLVMTTTTTFSGVLSNLASVAPIGGVVDVVPGNDDAGPVYVTVHPPNQPPVAVAGDDQTVAISTTVTLDGSASYDPDGNLPLTYGWRQTGGVPQVLLSNATASSPFFTAPGAPTVLTFTLAVTDALGLAGAPDTVVITTDEFFHIYLPLVLRDL